MIWELIICGVATIAFAIIFNIPYQLLWMIGLIGITSWSVFSFLPVTGVGPVPAAAVAAFTSALISHWCARKKRVPVTTFTIPGIIPLVPGGRAYETMLAFVQGDYVEGLAQTAGTLLQAGAIAGGLAFALSIFSIGRGVGQRYETNR
ncbi:integral membrane protein [Geomicrobium sp. JCM 19037]|nr:integral membrane protein [Geomicrobium sp. JCM 19037]GAK13913.1 integral membrane protein [Geomicrobium sp. JCM 19039]